MVVAEVAEIKESGGGDRGGYGNSVDGELVVVSGRSDGSSSSMMVDVENLHWRWQWQ